jgi:hypothetical protein
MSKSKPPIIPDASLDDPEQSKRFIDMARELESDERPETFERAFERVARKASHVRAGSKPKQAPEDG